MIRGVPIWGYNFDGLEPVDHAAASAAGLELDPHGDLSRCTLTGELPCTIDEGNDSVAGVVRFRLELPGPEEPPSPNPRNLHLATIVGDKTYEVADDWFEDGVLRLEELLPSPTRLRCCVTCLFSDYSPGGHGLMGMSCHRNAKEQYLAVKSKLDYWRVPVTEEVMETYVCPEYQRRVPGTGYRG